MPTGQEITYSATQPQKRVVTDRITMIDPMDIVAVSALGLNNESRFRFVNTPGVSYEWLEDSFSPRADAVNTSALTSDSTLTQITVDNGAYFQAGDVILIDDEYMWVSAVSSNVLDVTRDYGGTQATHSDDAVVTIVGRNRLEGADAGDSHFTEPTTGFNYSAILQKSIEISRSNALLERYGIGDVVNWEIDKKMVENMHLLNRLVYHGQRKAGGASTPRGFGGLKQLITSNTESKSGAALTRADIEDALQDCFDAGGSPDLLLCGGWAKRKIASFYEGHVRTERSETLGGITIDRIMMPLGIEVSVAVDRACPADDLFLLDTELTGLITVDPFFEESLGKVGDTAYYGQVVGEFGFVLQHEDAHAEILGFSTSA